MPALNNLLGSLGVILDPGTPGVTINQGRLNERFVKRPVRRAIRQRTRARLQGRGLDSGQIRDRLTARGLRPLNPKGKLPDGIGTSFLPGTLAQTTGGNVPRIDFAGLTQGTPQSSAQRDLSSTPVADAQGRTVFSTGPVNPATGKTPAGFNSLQEERAALLRDLNNIRPFEQMIMDARAGGETKFGNENVFAPQLFAAELARARREQGAAFNEQATLARLNAEFAGKTQEQLQPGREQAFGNGPGTFAPAMFQGGFSTGGLNDILTQRIAEIDRLLGLEPPVAGPEPPVEQSTFSPQGQSQGFDFGIDPNMQQLASLIRLLTQR